MPTWITAITTALRAWARALKRDITACGLALRHARTPWYAKVVLILTLAYALSPVDLIPDFIPVLGFLDDILIVPLGIWLACCWIPTDVFAQCRLEAGDQRLHHSGLRRLGLTLILIVWIAVAALAWLLWHHHAQSA